MPWRTFHRIPDAGAPGLAVHVLHHPLASRDLARREHAVVPVIPASLLVHFFSEFFLGGIGTPNFSPNFFDFS